MEQTKERAEERKDKLFNLRPLFFACVFLIYGIVFSYFKMTKGISSWWLLCLPLTGIPFFFCGIKGWEKITGLAALFILCFCVGLIAFRSQVYAFEDSKRYEGEVVVCGTVESKNRQGNELYCTLKNITVEGEETEGKIALVLTLPHGNSLRVADKITVKGEITTLISRGAYGFQNYKIAANERYALTATEDARKIGRSGDWCLRIRDRMERVLYEGMDETSAGLTLALLTGDVSGMEEGFWSNMRYGGISHIFAVSGLNVGALYLFCLLLFSTPLLKKLPKAVRFLLVAMLLILYAGICGFSASVLRATVFCILFYFVRLLGTNADMLETLGVAGIVILLLSPVEAFGVGFQLSFLACLGLFLLMKPIEKIFEALRLWYRQKHPRKYTEEELRILATGDTLPPNVQESVWKWLVALISASLSAQMMTLPALMIHFGYISGWSMLLNFIFVPVIDGIFTILLLFTLLACVLPIATAPVLLYLPSLAWTMLTLIFEIADFSTFALKEVQVSALSCVFYYGGLTFATDKWDIPEKRKKVLLWVFSLFFVGTTCLINL